MADLDVQQRALPDHVDPAHVIDYDLYSDRRFAEAGSLHSGLHQLAAEVGRGIFWTPRNGGHWFVNDHALLFQAVRDPGLFSSRSLMIPPQPDEPTLLPISLDPPVHGAYRLPLMRAFAPDMILALEAEIRSTAGGLIEAVRPNGRCEFVSSIAEPLPITIFMKLMGLPMDRLEEFRSWVVDILQDDVERRTAALGNVHEMMGALIHERQVERKDDLISRLIDAEINGRPASFEELQGYCLTLFLGGLDTVANTLAFCMVQLASDPNLQEWLRREPSRVPDAIEEVLRRYAVAPANRIISRDAEFGGVRLKKGDRVMLSMAACNLDPKVFPDPMKFDLDRENKTHITFNLGPHRCVGSHLARLELRVFLEEWVARMPTVRPDPAGACTYRAGASLAVQQLPIIWDLPA